MCTKLVLDCIQSKEGHFSLCVIPKRLSFLNLCYEAERRGTNGPILLRQAVGEDSEQAMFEGPRLRHLTVAEPKPSPDMLLLCAQSHGAPQ